MKLKTNIIIFSLIFLFFLLPQVNTLSCELELTCKKECSNLKVINGLNPTNEVSVTLNSATTDTNYIQYSIITFSPNFGM